MSVRSLALVLCISALSLTPAWASEKKVPEKPAIEMSESADPALERTPAAQVDPARVGAGVPEDAGQPDADAELAPPDPDDAPAATDTPAPAAAPVAAAEAAQPPPVPAEPVSWWREAASFLGLAPDPHPGETAEPAPGRPPLAPDYIIGPGDLLGISVWRDENLTRSVVVLPDGKIAFPLVGYLVAGGKTLAQLKGELERKLARYITEAGLTVEVKQSNSMVVYVIGRVNVPGRQMMVATTNVLQGLALAGGLNPFARRSEVKVFRKQEGKTSVFSFNYDDVAEGRHLETNIDLQKGDVILVP